MSRSLRSRPLTVYGAPQDGSAPAIPPVQHSQHQHQPSQSSTSSSRQQLQQRNQQYQQQQQQQQQAQQMGYHHQQQPSYDSQMHQRQMSQSSNGGVGPYGHPGVPSRTTSNQQVPTSGSSSRNMEPSSSSSGQTARKKASKVGSNLKKRLSTRYADDRRMSRAFLQEGYGAMPTMPTAYAMENQLSAEAYRNQQLGAMGPPQQDYGGRQRQETEASEMLEDYPAESYGNDNRNAMARQQSDAYLLPQSVEAERQISQTSTVSSLGGLGPIKKAAASAKQPTIAWEGSALKEQLDQNRQFGMDDLIDIDALRRQDEFDATSYLRLHFPPQMAPSAFTETLNSAKAAVRSDVKSQVFDHYSDFIAISSQVSALENEMIELKSLVGEWRGMPRVLEREDDSGKSILNSMSTLSKRTSLLSLQQVYRAQLTSLWEGISNSQKFIPYKPGRHLVAEAPDFVELNAATYRPLRNVALFLLDDQLLIASRKKGRMSTKVKLEAERCFALGDIVVVDLKDNVTKGSGVDMSSGSTSIKDSIKIKRGKETFVYRAEKPESKRALLNAFRRVAEDLANRKKTDSRHGAEAEQADQSSSRLSRRRSIYAGMGTDKSGGRSGLGNIDEDGGEEQGVMKLASEKVNQERKDPTRWLNDWSDGLAVDIALRQWQGACDKVTQGKAVLSTYTQSDPIYPVLTSRLDAHTGSLVSALLGAIQSPTLRKSSLISLATHLNSLGYSSIARQTFLTSREDLLRRRKRNIKFEGDTELYVAELSMVVFGMVRNTSEWFMAAWKETGMASGFVKWALAQIHAFALTFRRQVYGNNIDSLVTSAAMSQSKSASERQDQIRDAQFDRQVAVGAKRVAMETAQQLKDVGLDFGFVLEELLKTEEEQQKSAEALAARIEESLRLYDAKAAGEGTASIASVASTNTVNSNISTGSTPATTATSSPSKGPSSVASRIAAMESRSDQQGSSSPSRSPRKVVPALPSTPSRANPTSTSTFSPASPMQAPPTPIIPSLTLTLADEASGISRRISSANLPNITAQEIRRRSIFHGGGGSGAVETSSPSRRVGGARTKRQQPMAGPLGGGFTDPFASSSSSPSKNNKERGGGGSSGGGGTWASNFSFEGDSTSNSQGGVGGLGGIIEE